MIAIQNNRLYFLRIMALRIINDCHRRRKIIIHWQCHKINMPYLRRTNRFHLSL
ncbi:hypothetical protein XY01_001802 [Salmonella enterica subsp. enterica]|nr:hypothetical protein [Salmonella enterica subsp. enterica]